MPIGSALPPGFKAAGVLQARTLVQVVSVEDERLSFGVEHASGGFPSVAVAGYVIDFRNVQVARSDEFTNVAVFALGSAAIADSVLLKLREALSAYEN